MSTPLQDEVDDDDRMSLSSLSSANEQIIEQQTVEQQNQLYTPAFAALPASHLTSVPPPSVISNPLIPTLYQQRSLSSMTTPSPHPSSLHIPTNLVPPPSQRLTQYVTSLHPMVATRPPLQAQLPPATFYGAADQFGRQISYWGQAQQPTYIATATSDPATAYYPFSNAYAGVPCHEPVPQHSATFMHSSNQGLDNKDVYACSQYSHAMLYPHDEKTLHLADSKIVESPHFKTIE